MKKVGVLSKKKYRCGKEQSRLEQSGLWTEGRDLIKFCSMYCSKTLGHVPRIELMTSLVVSCRRSSLHLFVFFVLKIKMQ